MSQTSIVFSQRTWPGVGDLDDCWVLSSLQCVHAVTPWNHLPGSNVFRKAAGDPDDGDKDGGNIVDISKGVTTLYPEFKGKLVKMFGVSWDAFRVRAREAGAVSVMVMPAKLPARLNHGAVLVPHQVTIVVEGEGDRKFANPMAQPQTKWEAFDWSEIEEAVRAFGNGKCFAVGFPKPESMVRYAPGFAAALKKAIDALPKPDCSAEHAAGYADAKAVALAAVSGI